jgi:prepilin-type processing-associated H-X9-DG protein
MNDKVPPPGTNTPPATNPPPDIVLASSVGSKQIWRCPSDDRQLFATTGNSYSWNVFLNGQSADNMSILGLPFDPHQVPLLFDKESFHRARGPKKEVNYLYADGHIQKLLEVEGTK